MRMAAQVQAEMLLLPHEGAHLPREVDSIWASMLLPQAAEISRWEGQAEAMVSEIDPRQSAYLLPEWEALMGPDPYGRVTVGLSTGQLQAYLYQRLTRRGSPTPAYFVALAASLGVSITVTEQQQTIYGVARYGQRYLSTPNQFQWLVTLPAEQVDAAEYGSARYGDCYGNFSQNPVQPVITAQAPAHTLPVFSYTG